MSRLMCSCTLIDELGFFYSLAERIPIEEVA